MYRDMQVAPFSVYLYLSTPPTPKSCLTRVPLGGGEADSVLFRFSPKEVSDVKVSAPYCTSILHNSTKFERNQPEFFF